MAIIMVHDERLQTSYYVVCISADSIADGVIDLQRIYRLPVRKRTVQLVANADVLVSTYSCTCCFAHSFSVAG